MPRAAQESKSPREFVLIEGHGLAKNTSSILGMDNPGVGRGRKNGRYKGLANRFSRAAGKRTVIRIPWPRYERTA